MSNNFLDDKTIKEVEDLIENPDTGYEQFCSFMEKAIAEKRKEIDQIKENMRNDFSEDKPKKVIENPLTSYERCYTFMMNAIEEKSKEIDQIKENLFNGIARRECDNGKSFLHRGYYCPSMVKDLWVGGCGHRKLLKVNRKPKGEHNEFLFDKNNKLRVVVHHDRFTESYEIIFNYYGYSVGITYDKDFKEVTYCCWTRYINGRIDEYVCFYSSPRRGLTLDGQEKYHYSEDSIECFSKASKYSNLYKITFSMEDGCICSHTVEEYLDNGMPVNEPSSYNLGKKRNIQEFETSVNTVYI